MEKIIIEIFHANHLLKRREVFKLTAVKVGRGYQNDLILSDPYVSVDHVFIRIEDKKIIVEDSGSENSFYLKKESKFVTSAILDSGDEIVIGETPLRIILPSHPVAAAKLRSKKSTARRLINVWTVVPLLFLLFIFKVYCANSDKLPFSKLILDGFLGLILVFIWIGIWSLVARVIKHRAYFSAQLAIVSFILIISFLLNYLVSYIGYLFISTWKMNIVTNVIMLSVFFPVILNSNLSIATDISRRIRFTIAGIVTLLIIITSTLYYCSVEDKFRMTPNYYSVIKPPFINVKLGRSIDSFFKDSEVVFDIKEK